jgi:stress response protein SCP2/uncharacterized protein YegL
MFQKGQKSKITDLGLNSKFLVNCNLKSSLSIDITCFGVDINNQLSDDRYMIFYNQKNSPSNEIKLIENVPNSKFQLNLDTLPENIVKLVFTAAIDGSETMNKLNSLDFLINEHSFILTGSDFSQEKAIIIAEIYKKDSVWRLNAVGQGFNGGLSELLAYFGGTQADEKTLPQITSSKLTLSKQVFLDKRLSLEKDLEKTAPKLLTLSKTAAISLKKVGLDEHKAKVALCLDISASMRDLYKSGIVQAFVEKILALGCRLDDDGAIDIFLFGANGYQPAPISFKDFQGYVDKTIKLHPLEGDTRYSCAFEMVRKYYLDYKYERSEPAFQEIPTYVMFLTDGQPSDKANSTRSLKNASFEPIFWQFIGVGNADFSYLEKLDDLSGRYVDNADFFSIKELNQYSDEQLYSKLTNEYPTWLKEAVAKKLIPHI